MKRISLITILTAGFMLLSNPIFGAPAKNGVKKMTVNLSDELNFAKFEKAFDWSNGKQGAQTGWLLDINLSKYCEDVKNIKGKSIQVLWNGSVDQNINGISLILLDTSSDANFYRELSNRKSVSFTKGALNFDQTFDLYNNAERTVVLRLEYRLSACKDSAILKSSSFIEAQIPANLKTQVFDGKTYKATFYDDFSGSVLNKAKWNKCPENQRQDAGGYWDDECSFVRDGNLVIQCRMNGNTPESGAVFTKGIFEQTQGLFKIRFKASKADGLWFAWWLMYDGPSDLDGTAKLDGEIDIFEVISNDPNEKPGKHGYLNSAMHWDGYEKGTHKSKENRFHITDDFYKDWHTVTFVWDDYGYRAYMDDSTTPYWDADYNDGWGGKTETPHHILITAEFGKWNGTINPKQLPCEFLVDWVWAGSIK